MLFLRLSTTDDEYIRIAEWMSRTIMTHKCVRLSEFSIKQMLEIKNPVLLERFSRSKQRIECKNGGGSCELVELFHGSPFAIEIAVSGFNEQHCKENNMFGKGNKTTIGSQRSSCKEIILVTNCVYFTKHASKANQFSWGANTGCPEHNDRNCDICLRYLLVCSCLMGKQFRATFQPLAAAPIGFDSIVAEPSSVKGIKYAEFVLLSGEQALPKVLVAYHAVRYQEQE
ncbi:Hypothetical predicted protein [Cloeon dipterum]|uniref:Uncharacterized protein n=1 Tax=Cloeon dipterum TaxID=197152 RepID=A0A8S1DJN7_9INSE|nr:Hypothetical predicted protein [Cloeon dipterum]